MIVSSLVALTLQVQSMAFTSKNAFKTQHGNTITITVPGKFDVTKFNDELFVVNDGNGTLIIEGAESSPVYVYPGINTENRFVVNPFAKTTLKFRYSK
jgi:mannose-6-phosphate isomerase-like protein (cupin superfamily)